MTQGKAACRMQEAKKNLGISLYWNSVAVQEMFEGFYEEISNMAFFSAVYYAQFMCEAKYAARAPRNLLSAIGRASELEELLPKVTRAALVQRERFLCNLCPEQTFFGFFEYGVRDREKKRMAEVLMRYIQ